MTAKLNHPKRLYWYMALATIGLFALFSTSPQVMDSTKTTVAGSSAYQHAFGVDQSAQIKRHLRVNAEMAEDIDGDSDERAFIYINPEAWNEAVNEAVAAATIKFERNVVAPITLTTTDKLLENVYYREWAKIVESQHTVDPYKAEALKIFILQQFYNTKTLRRVITAGKTVEYTKAAADKLEIGLALILMESGRVGKALRLLRDGKDGLEFLKSPLWTALIAHGTDDENKKLYELLSNDMKKHFSKTALAKMFLELKENTATEELGAQLEQLQLLETWLTDKRTGADVFDLLQLGKADKAMFKSPAWDTWVLYMHKLADKLKLGDAVALMFKTLWQKVEHKELANAITKGKAYTPSKKLAEGLELEMKAMLHRPPKKRFFENGDNGVTTTKRQHRQNTNDDRQ